MFIIYGNVQFVPGKYDEVRKSATGSNREEEEEEEEEVLISVAIVASSL